MNTRKRKPADLTGFRQCGAQFQVRIFGGIDPATGRQLILTGSAATETPDCSAAWCRNVCTSVRV